MTIKAATAVLLSALLLLGQSVPAAQAGSASGPECGPCQCARCDATCCSPAPAQPFPPVPAAPAPDSIRGFLQVAGSPPAMLLYAMGAPRALEAPVSDTPSLQAATVPLFRWDCALLI